MQVRVVDTMVIGRGDHASGFSPEVDLTSFDAFAKGVSRKHALITIKDQRLMIRDLNSTNGTRLNNVICKPGEEYRLRHGNELMFGTLRIQASYSVVPALTDTQLVPELSQDRMGATLPLIPGNGKRILLIEEDNDVGQVFRVALEYAGYKVQLVNDVTKALGIVFQGMPDAIVLDLTVPDMNGLDLVRYVRKQKTGQHIPALVISSSVGGFQMNQALAAGADAFMGKPIAVDELVQALGKALRGEKSLPSVVPPAVSPQTLQLPR
jgi:CheY-like chemotaxis protein